MPGKVIIGAGRHAAEVFCLMEDLGQVGDLLAFAKDEGKGNELFMGREVWSVADLIGRYREGDKPAIIVAIGDIPTNKRLTFLLRQNGFEFFNLIHSGVNLSRQRRIGTGIYIADGAVLTLNISLGDNVIVNTGCTVSHDCTIGDFVNISPGSHLAGGVVIEDDVFVGVGATFIPKVTVGKGSVVAAGACVTRDVPPNSLVAGIPAVVKKFL